MGFFLDEAAVVEPPRPLATNRVTAKRNPTTKQQRVMVFDPAMRGCEHCALRAQWPQLTSPKMRPTGNRRDADVLVLGEGPGETEDRQGKVFVGKTGTLLRTHLPARHQERLLFQNAVRCRPPENRTPTGPEMHACSLHLERDIEQLKLKAILGVGGAPLARYFPETTILRAHGIKFPVRIGEQIVWYFPIFHPSFVARMRDEHQGKDDGPALPVFRADIKRFFRELDNWPKPKIANLSPKDVVVAWTEEEARSVLSRMDKHKAVDLETTKLRPYEKGAIVLSAAFSDGKLTVAFPIQHPEHPTTWGLPLLLETIKRDPFIAHSATMELSWFRWLLGSPLAQHAPFDDTMCLARLYHERESIRGLELLSRIHLGINVKALAQVKASRIMDYPLSEILPYNGLDALATALLYQKTAHHVNKRDYARLLKATSACVGMELSGLQLDLQEAGKLDRYWSGRAASFENDSKRIYEVRQYENDTGKEFKLGNPILVGQVLHDYGKLDLPKNSKGYVTDDEVLTKLAPDNPLVQGVLGYREAVKMKSTYIVPVLTAHELYVDALLHPGYETTRTATQRLSSNSPNIQNWPKRRHREIRRMVTVDGRYVIVVIDYGQLEARVMAMAARDRVLCDLIITGYDIHSHWLDRLLFYAPDYLERLAHKTNQSDPVKIRKMGRDIIKTDFVFSSFFGSSSKSIARNTGIPLEIIQKIHREFWGEFRATRDWMDARYAEYKETGSITTLSGRTRHSILWGNEPLNTPIQGTAADIVVDSMNDMAEMARRENDIYLHPRINIHDDLTFILPNDNDLSSYISYITKVLTRVRYDWQIVPLTVEVKIGSNWCDLEDVGVFTGDYIR